jgi:hypothetical protein
MGFLQLIPATELQAVYDGETRTLMLRAQGHAQNYTNAIHFVAGPSPAAADTFRLMGWVGPIGKGTTAYDHVQRFESAEYPGAYVQIEDAEHPAGARVRVEVIPGAAASAATSATPPATEVRRVALGGVLEVRAAVWDQRGATQSLERDAAFLALESAGIQNPSGGSEIVWSLRGQKPGETKVKLLSVGGLTPIATSRTIQVIIEPIPAK